MLNPQLVNPIFITLYKDIRYSFQVEAWMKEITQHTIIGNWHAIQLNNAFDGSDVKWNEGQGGTFTKDMCNGSFNQ